MPAGTDYGRGGEPVVVRRLTSPKGPALEAARAAGAQVLEGRYTVRKYWGDVADNQLYEVVETAPNLFLTAGITEVLKLAAGQAATAFSTANARLAVGSSTTAAAAGQTALVTEIGRQIVDSAPVVSTNSVTFVATFGTASANAAWNEIGVCNAAAAGTFWSRTVSALGTKSSAASWVLSWSLSIS